MTKALQEHRRRLAARGLQRVEVSIPAADAELLRRVAKTLAKDSQGAERLRMAIEQAAPNKQPIKFKEWLTSLSDDD